MDQFHIPNYEVNHIKVGNGKGITTFHTQKFCHVCDIVCQKYQITKYESDHVVSINVYRSTDGSVESILDNVRSLENQEKANIITGDMNICALRERKSLLVTALTDLGYKLLTKESTHIKGRQIDHAYTKNATASLDLYTPYYSDHDALCVAVDKVLNGTKFIIYTNCLFSGADTR